MPLDAEPAELGEPRVDERGAVARRRRGRGFRREAYEHPGDERQSEERGDGAAERPVFRRCSVGPLP
ncbi:hypothetical protein GCM10027258_58070 [Amycolatopsis stemonae]